MAEFAYSCIEEDYPRIVELILEDTTLAIAPDVDYLTNKFPRFVSLGPDLMQYLSPWLRFVCFPLRASELPSEEILGPNSTSSFRINHHVAKDTFTFALPGSVKVDGRTGLGRGDIHLPTYYRSESASGEKIRATLEMKALFARCRDNLKSEMKLSRIANVWLTKSAEQAFLDGTALLLKNGWWVDRNEDRVARYQ